MKLVITPCIKPLRYIIRNNMFLSNTTYLHLDIDDKPSTLETKFVETLTLHRCSKFSLNAIAIVEIGKRN